MSEVAAIVEEWRAVVGFEGLYEVSSLGLVRRVGNAAKSGNGRGGGARLGRVLALTPHNGGYVHVQLWKDGTPTTRLVHLVVAAAFLGPCPDGLEVNHEDGDKSNCAVTNLEYLTRPENLRHAYRTGLRKVSIEQAVRARRKPRVLIACACGCGTQIETLDRKGRDRKFVSGHNTRKEVLV
jgi:hypothetical protein